MSAPKTIFQKIADQEIPAKLIHADELCVAFHDIAPQAPTHVLVVPRKPLPRVGEAGAEDQQAIGLGQSFRQRRVHADAQIACIIGVAVVDPILTAESDGDGQAGPY